MALIYVPDGRAAEYAQRALNIYKGCTHACRYCYGKRRLSATQKADYDTNPNPKADFIAKLRKEAAKFPPDTPEILLSFLGDVYQPAEMELRLTRQAIEILIENDLPFTILTKGGTRAVRDFDLLEGYPKARFGTTLIFSEQKHSDHWEPGAATIVNRIATIRIARRRGIKTWVSLEPVINPEQALALIYQIHPFVDHWKIGKINYHTGIDVDWIVFREEAKALLDSLGAEYYMKKSLTES